MNKLLTYREQLNLTQEQLSEKAKVSVRTIQRIEAGQTLKGHTLEALSNALGVSKEKLLGEDVIQKEKNILLIKLINLSSLLLIFIPFGSIVLPLLIMYWKKEVNAITKQIVSIQILWTILFPVIVLIVVFLNNIFRFNRQVIPLTMLFLFIVNIYIILRNIAELHQKEELRIKLKFSII
ncbi:helix-turn-helix domain-containing protein [Tenacibaculum agarivorans]|uniref:helix-turn-helix domain-containing protein n=1 Tax=Tenacibaculum agarivorans TaxID=1908389 RepID=UPI00094B9ADC|nr:helix-turn-helix transcriptional regulator [Tenacibaculum agarivorans]